MTDQVITDTTAPSHQDSHTAAIMCDICGRPGTGRLVVTAALRRSAAPRKTNPFLSICDLGACGRDLPSRERWRRLCWLFRNIANDWSVCERCVDHMVTALDRNASNEEDAGSDAEGCEPDTAYTYEGGDD